MKPELRDKFVEATLDDARGSVGDEPGCYRFDVIEDAPDPDLVHLHEVFEDQAALETHRNMADFTKWVADVDDCRADRLRLVEGNTVFPSDGGWRSQKSLLLS